jgi:hypothetical protein
MSKKKFTIDPIEYASEGNGILGIRDSGKSYTATGFAEQIMDAGIPIIAFDAIGIWKHLRILKNGKPGYPIVIVGGKNGDIPLSPTNIVPIVRAAMKNNISLVIDLFSMELSKADWRRIVESCIRLLLYENEDYGQRHIFIEEAAEFCPQKLQPDQGKVYAEIEKLARMGGNVSLGFTLINQRSEDINKSVLELCDAIFLHRQKGKNSITNLGKWLSVADTDNSKEIVKSLPSLDQGECWVWLPGSHLPVRTKMPEKKTVHPDRKKRIPFLKLGKPADVTKQLAIINAAIVPVQKIEVKKDTIKNSVPSVDKTKLDSLNKEISYLNEQIQENKMDLRQHKLAIKKAYDTLHRVKNIYSTITETIEDLNLLLSTPDRIVKRVKEHKNKIPTPSITNKTGVTDPGDSSVGKCERAILMVLAQRDQATSKNQVAILSSYSVKSSGFNNGISKLRVSGYITGSGDALEITEQGKAVLGPYDPLPTGEALHRHWLDKLGKCEAAILAFLIAQAPNTRTRSEIAEATSYSVQSSGFNNGLSKLRVLQLIEGKTDMKASGSLFEF